MDPDSRPGAAPRRPQDGPDAIREERDLLRARVDALEDTLRRLRADKEDFRPRRDEETLESARFALRAAETIPSILYVFDVTTGQNVYVNRQITEVLGYTPAEVQEMGSDFLATLLHPDDAARVPELLGRWKDASDEDCLLTDYRMRARSGEWRWFHSRDRVFTRDDQGRVTKIIGATMDVTDQRLAEHERMELQRRLQAAQKMEAVGTLAGGIAHDFNNLLAVILGNCQLALDKQRHSEDVVDNLEEILTAGMRARDIVRQILRFARPREGEGDVVAAEASLRDALRLVRRFLPTTLTLVESVEVGPALLRISTAEMHQVIMNLCANARDALPHGGTLEVRARVLDRAAMPAAPGSPDPAREGLLLEVLDDGHGIAPEHRERIFDPFFSTRVGTGTGLGLAVVYGVVARYGGSVSVSDREGAPGTHVRVWLPLADAEARASSSDGDDPAPESVGPTAARILWVDDEEQVLGVGSAMLHRLGYRIAPYRDPVRALEAFRADPHAFDLVLTDQLMPELTGLRLAEEIRAIRPDVPVVLCLGHADVPADPAVVDGMILKPMLLPELARALETHLSGENRVRRT